MFFRDKQKHSIKHRNKRIIRPTVIHTNIYMHNIRSVVAWNFKYHADLKNLYASSDTKWIMNFYHMLFWNNYIFLHCRLSSILKQFSTEEVISLINNMSIFVCQYHHGYLTERKHVPTKIKKHRVWKRQS